MQCALFSSDTNLLPRDGKVVLFENALNVDFDTLRDEIEWRHEKIRLFGKRVLQPRLTAWYGDPGTDYVYSGLKNTPKAWTPTLQAIKHKIEEYSKTRFNSVLLNLYRDGQDSMGWHQDNEPELGDNPVIASLSFGASRKFQMRHKFDKTLAKLDFELHSGSLLIMSGQTQQYWQHQLAKTKKAVGQRINLTFRTIHHKE
ncbi:MAG: alpha-ketoglutarate-dependent dioxygenase AlkB [Gammaproteobacteria bacterium]|nr:alpha-ketoglutarate-dependent dioxygenase AlkB [Gammaproteobacteria bacterium]NNM13447.1 alpha-ketoglutarate-dependent dioxygenase AlkB [Gammaproteobacteria bacterium]